MHVTLAVNLPRINVLNVKKFNNVQNIVNRMTGKYTKNYV